MSSPSLPSGAAAAAAAATAGSGATSTVMASSASTSTHRTAVVDVNSHALPLTGPDSSLLDRAAHPLGVLAMFERATTGVGPKLLAGGLSCMLISGVLNFTDVVKVRLQTQNPLAPRYNGFGHALRTIWAEEGARGLMRGFTASMIREASYSSLRMGLYDSIKIFLAPSSTAKDDFTLLHKIAAGCASGAMGAALASPSDLVKIRFQGYSPERPNPYPHTGAAFADIWRREGLRGLYTGATPTIARAAILTGSQLSSYDHSKRMMLRSRYFDDTPATHLIASLISGLVTATVVNPADVIKTRVMNDSAHELYRNPVDCIVKTMRHEGPRAFMKGWVPGYARLGPHFIVSLPLAEFIRVKLGAESM